MYQENILISPRVKTDIKLELIKIILDEAGPFSKETTNELPRMVLLSLWEEYFHYLNLVAENAKIGGGK